MAEFNYPNGDLLVSVVWLAQHLHDPNVKIIDARSAQDYTAGHIPGAVLLPNGAFRSTRGVPDACTPEEFAATAGALGVRTTGHMLESPETNIDTATLERQVCRDSRRPLSKIWSSLAVGIAISPYSSSLACTPCPECA